MDQYLAQDRAQLAVRRLQALRLRARERPHDDRPSHPPEAGVGRPERVHHGPVRHVGCNERYKFLLHRRGVGVYVALMPPDATGRPDPLATLTELLRTALYFTADLTGDAHLPRLLGAFARLPAADRKPLLEKLESEVQARQRSAETGDGVVGPPNPLSSLYVRLYENDRPVPRVTRDSLLRSAIQSTAQMRGFPQAVRVEVEDALFAGMAALAADDADALARRPPDLLAPAAWCGRADADASV